MASDGAAPMNRWVEVLRTRTTVLGGCDIRIHVAALDGTKTKKFGKSPTEVTRYRAQVVTSTLKQPLEGLYPSAWAAVLAAQDAVRDSELMHQIKWNDYAELDRAFPSESGEASRAAAGLGATGSGMAAGQGAERAIVLRALRAARASAHEQHTLADAAALEWGERSMQLDREAIELELQAERLRSSARCAEARAREHGDDAMQHVETERQLTSFLAQVQAGCPLGEYERQIAFGGSAGMVSSGFVSVDDGDGGLRLLGTYGTAGGSGRLLPTAGEADGAHGWTSSSDDADDDRAGTIDLMSGSTSSSGDDSSGDDTDAALKTLAGPARELANGLTEERLQRFVCEACTFHGTHQHLSRICTASVRDC